METIKAVDVFPISNTFRMMKDCHEVLKVPVLDGVLQVGIVKPTEFTNITLTKHSSDIYIAREDKKPIQVEVHPLFDMDGTDVKSVFDIPVSRGIGFSYFDSKTADDLWSMDVDRAIVKDRYALHRFTKELANQVLIRHVRVDLPSILVQRQEFALASSS